MYKRQIITELDQKVLYDIEEYGSMTITQCENLYYNTQKTGYTIACKHLQKLFKYGKLKNTKDVYFNRSVYYIDKKPNFHGIVGLDYRAELVRHGAFINVFKQEYPWMNNKYFSDAFCCYTYKGSVFYDFVEVVRYKGVEPKKYIDIFNSHEAHKVCAEINKKLGLPQQVIFPRLVIIDEVKHKKELYIDDQIKVIQLNYKFENFEKLFM
jgi:hypothetical protein